MAMLPVVRQMLSWGLGMLAGFACLASGRADVPLSTYRDELPCSSAVFHLTTARLVDPSNDLTECAEQSLSFTSGEHRGSTAIGLETRSSGTTVLGYRVLDGRVVKWACIRSTQGRDFLLLFYACRGSGDRCAMHGRSAEWGEVIDSKGRLVTGGRNGFDTRRLERRGLDAPLKAGVTAHDVGPNAMWP
jgi:hypothetical protein